MATPLDFHRASVMAFKGSLEEKTSKEKDKHISIQVAEQFNKLIDNIKQEHPEVAAHLPQPITFNHIACQDMQIADIRFLDFEMLLNQVLAIIEVLRSNK